MTADLLFAATVKVSLVLLAGLVVAGLLRRRSAAARHWVLSVAVLCALLLPAVWAVGPTWSMPSAVPPVEVMWSGSIEALLGGADGAHGADGAPATGSPASGQVASGPRGPSVSGTTDRPTRPSSGRQSGPAINVISVWLAGAGAGVALLLVGFARLAWLRGRATPVVGGPWRALADEIGGALGLSRPVQVLQSRHPTLLATWGLVRPKVLLPAGAERWPGPRMRVVLAHELAHVRRGDWAWQVCAELLRAALWFNPLTWIVLRRQRRDSELACDDEVLGLGVAGPAYASQLLDLVQVLRSRRTLWSPGVAMARPSGFERRIAAMMNPSLRRQPLARGTRMAIVIAASCLTVPLAILAQPGPASISGTVVDPAGQPWAGARISLVPVGQFSVVSGDVLLMTTGPTSTIMTASGNVIRTDGRVIAGSIRIDGRVIAGRIQNLVDGIWIRAVDSPDGRFEIQRDDAGRVFEVQSDDAGRFDIQDVPPGDYRLRVRLAGFADITEAVTLQAGQRQRRDFVLAIRSLEETVNVTTADSEPVVTTPEETLPSLRRLTNNRVRFNDGRLMLPVKVQGLDAPAYPEELRRLGVEGKVTIEGIVATDGSLQVLNVLAPVNPDSLTAVQPELARAAVTLVRQWQYEPGMLNDVAVDLPITVTVNFVGES